MNAARTAVRKAATDVTILNFMGPREVAAYQDEVELALIDGVGFLHCSKTIRITDHAVKWVAVERVGAEDGSVSFEDDFARTGDVEADAVIIAVGQGPGAGVGRPRRRPQAHAERAAGGRRARPDLPAASVRGRRHRHRAAHGRRGRGAREARRGGADEVCRGATQSAVRERTAPVGRAQEPGPHRAVHEGDRGERQDTWKWAVLPPGPPFTSSRAEMTCCSSGTWLMTPTSLPLSLSCTRASMARSRALGSRAPKPSSTKMVSSLTPPDWASTVSARPRASESAARKLSPPDSVTAGRERLDQLSATARSRPLFCSEVLGFELAMEFVALAAHGPQPLAGRNKHDVEVLAQHPALERDLGAVGLPIGDVRQHADHLVRGVDVPLVAREPVQGFARLTELRQTSLGLRLPALRLPGRHRCLLVTRAEGGRLSRDWVFLGGGPGLRELPPGLTEALGVSGHRSLGRGDLVVRHDGGSEGLGSRETVLLECGTEGGRSCRVVVPGLAGRVVGRLEVALGGDAMLARSAALVLGCLDLGHEALAVRDGSRQRALQRLLIAKVLGDAGGELVGTSARLGRDAGGVAVRPTGRGQTSLGRLQRRLDTREQRVAVGHLGDL